MMTNTAATAPTPTILDVVAHFAVAMAMLRFISVVQALTGASIDLKVFSGVTDLEAGWVGFQAGVRGLHVDIEARGEGARIRISRSYQELNSRTLYFTFEDAPSENEIRKIIAMAKRLPLL
jgi:hypothetical protein